MLHYTQAGTSTDRRPICWVARRLYLPTEPCHAGLPIGGTANIQHPARCCAFCRCDAGGTYYSSHSCAAGLSVTRAPNTTMLVCKSLSPVPVAKTPLTATPTNQKFIPARLLQRRHTWRLVSFDTNEAGQAGLGSARGSNISAAVATTIVVLVMVRYWRLPMPCSVGWANSGSMLVAYSI